MKFNVPAIQAIAAQAVGANECTFMEKIAEGELKFTFINLAPLSRLTYQNYIQVLLTRFSVYALTTMPRLSSVSHVQLSGIRGWLSPVKLQL